MTQSNIKTSKSSSSSDDKLKRKHVTKIIKNRINVNFN